MENLVGYVAQPSTQESNIILSRAYEYRLPSTTAIETAASKDEAEGKRNVRVDMTSRFMGLIVVPGKHITKIEVEEWRGKWNEAV